MPDARDVIRAITAIEPATTKPYKRLSPEQGDEIARLFEGDFSLFMELDEQPGRFTSPYYHGQEGVYGYSMWHYKLRQARNSAPHFFEILNSRDGKKVEV